MDVTRKDNCWRTVNRLMVVFLAAAVVAAFTPAAAQQQVTYQEQAETAFSKGLRAFREGDYRKAEQAFGDVITKYPTSHRITAAMIMRGKALFALNESYDASKVVKALLERYPSSRYIPDAELMLGKIYAHIERYEEAKDALFRAWRALPSDAPPRLREEVMADLDTLLETRTSLEGLHAMLRQGGWPAERAHLWLLVAQRELAQGNSIAASAAMDSITTRYAGFVSQESLDPLQRRLSGVADIKIGIVLPLMRKSPPSAIKEVGNEVYDGIMTAYDRFQARHLPVHLILETRDTDREVQAATDVTRELVKDGSVICLLGPVFSATTTAAARVAAANHVPLVTPTANQNGIAALGASVFQANADYEQRGRAMARYAVLQLGSRVLGVLAPSDSYAKFLADGFIKEAKALGATVVVTEWYQKGAADLRSQMQNIRHASYRLSAEPMVSFARKMSREDVAKLVRLGVPSKRIDSLLARSSVVPARWLLGTRAKAVLDSAGVPVWYDESRADSLRQATANIEALYCPISSPEEIGMISSQIVYNNIKARILGSGEWNNMTELETNRRYCLGVQFESDSYVDTSSASYKEFFSAFTARFKKRPGKNTLYGYDAASVVLSVISNGATTREALVKALAAVHDFQGVKGRVGFTEGRVNAWLNVLEYTQDGIMRVGETRGSD